MALAWSTNARAQVGRPGRPRSIVVPGRTPPRDSTAKRDSLARRDSLSSPDSTRADTALVQWVEPDSVMKALMGRTGYDLTRFQGARATYDARTKDLRLDANQNEHAAVDRNGQLSVSDSAIFYNETTGDVSNFGHYVINLPGSTEAPIRGIGRYSYNVKDRFGQFTNAKLPFNNGEDWYLDITTGAVKMDSAKAGAATIYIDGGKITSCPDSVPDYYFAVKTAKRTTSNTVVGRDVTLYIGDVPVLWLPFIFQNVHGGRSSGLLTTKFGISDIVRNSPTYHRNVENLGYYWALSDYMDAAAWLDWRSGAGGSNVNDPGYVQTNVDYQYNWLNRFLSGFVRAKYMSLGNGSSNLGLTWSHGQRFSNDGNLNLNINYTSNTTVQRQNTFDPVQALATIHSDAQYSRKFGPATLSLGGSRTQYPGRVQVDQSFPNLTLSTAPISIGPHVIWTPSFSLSATQSLHIDQPGPFQFRFRDTLGKLDSVESKRNSYTTSITVGTPLKIFGQEFGNAFSVNSQRNQFPDLVTVHDIQTGDSTGVRVYGETFRTNVDWTPNFQLPPLGQNRFNLSPSITLANVDPNAFWVATERSNGKFVSQSKRLSYGLNASPTLYARFSGFGPFTTFRHSISPSFGYSYAPAGHVSDEYLAATGQIRKGYLGAISQNLISFGVSTALEAKVASSDTLAARGNAIKVLSLNMSSFSYNLSRLNTPEVTSKAWWRGLQTQQFNYSVHSDLLPGIEFSSSYSLFQGSTTSDTAIFKPYREQMSATLNLSRDQNPFAVLTKLFGKAVPAAQHAGVAPVDPNTTPQQDATARELAAQPVAGARTAGERFLVPPSQGWRLALSLSSTRQRPPVGGNIVDFDPAQQCAKTANGDQFLLNLCTTNAHLQSGNSQPVTSPTPGGTVYRLPPQTNVNADLGFNLTPRWTAAWRTSYDFVRHEFANHVVSLQRDLHDWRLSMGFTKSSNGNFAFNFSIGLKAQPDLKFDYARNSMRSGGF
jgi:LptD protein